jgi:two-component system response regulator DegU
MKLLIVDDNEAIRQVTKRVLQSIVTGVRECEDGSDALSAYQQFLPDFVLMDVEMKQVDGITATREIVAQFPAAKIIIVTNYDDEALREAARTAGACAYVVKDEMAKIRQYLSGFCSEKL